MPDQEQLNNLLYKYVQGFPYTSTIYTRGLEKVGSSFPKISTNQLMKSTPPSTSLYASSTIVPTNISGFTATTFSNITVTYSGGSKDVSGGRVYIPSGTNSSYSYLAYYVNIPLKCIDTNYTAFYDASTDVTNVTGTNRLAGAIPSNYDPAGNTYKIFVFTSDASTNPIEIDGETNSWYFDPNSGYLVFDNSINYVPTITFWRYEGTYGISSSQWTTSGNNIYYSLGNVGIGRTDPTFVLDVSGTIRSNQQITALSFNATSDYRFKNNVQPIDPNKTVDDLRPVEYDLSSGTHDMGFIAHEVQDIFPFLVNGEKDNETLQSLNYNGFIALLVKEIQVLKERIKNLEDKMNSKNANV